MRLHNVLCKWTDIWIYIFLSCKCMIRIKTKHLKASDIMRHLQINFYRQSRYVVLWIALYLQYQNNTFWGQLALIYYQTNYKKTSVRDYEHTLLGTVLVIDLRSRVIWNHVRLVSIICSHNHNQSKLTDAREMGMIYGYCYYKCK